MTTIIKIRHDFAVDDMRDVIQRSGRASTLESFCTSFLPRSFSHPFHKGWSELLKLMEQPIRHGGLTLSGEVDRGSGTTTILCAAAFWAVLRTGHRRVLFATESDCTASALLMAAASMLLDFTTLSQDEVLAMRTLRPPGGGEILNIEFVGPSRARERLNEPTWRGDSRGVVICDSLRRPLSVATLRGNLSVIDLVSADRRGTNISSAKPAT